MKRRYIGNLRIISSHQEDVILPFSYLGMEGPAWDEIQQLIINERIWSWEKVRLENISAEWVNEENE